METANTNPEAKVSENPEEIEEDKKNKTIQSHNKNTQIRRSSIGNRNSHRIR